MNCCLPVAIIRVGYMRMYVFVFIFYSSRGKKEGCEKAWFLSSLLLWLLLFWQLMPSNKTWLSGKFVAVYHRAALHSNQQLSTQPRPLLMTATNCLTNSRHYLRASVKWGYTLSVCCCGLMERSQISNNTRNYFWALSHLQELTHYVKQTICNWWL